MKLLFVCPRNLLRSPTAEQVFSDYSGVDAIGAGTHADSETPLSGDLIEWANEILVRGPGHRRVVTNRFQALLRDRRLTVLGIADDYDRMDPKLIELLKRRVSQCVNLPARDHSG